MSYPIDKIVNINILLGATGLGRTNFGATALFDGSNHVEGFQAYSSYAEVAAVYDGGSDEEARVLETVAAFFGELPSPNQILIYGFEAVNDGITDDSAALQAAIEAAANTGTWFYWDFFVNGFFPSSSEDTEAMLNANEALEKYHIWATGSALATDPDSEDDIGSVMQRLQNRHSSAVYSQSSDHHAGIRVAARWSSVDFTGLNTVPTMELKAISQGGDSLSTPANNTLIDKGYFLNTQVAAKGSTVSPVLINTRSYSAYGEWIDDIVGTDAFAADLQRELFNAKRTVTAKLKYQPAGQQVLIAAAQIVCEQYIRNGFLGERLITDLLTGEQRVSRGYEIWTLPTDILLVDDDQRSDRAAASISLSFYRAGAIHSGTINAIGD